MLYQSQIIKSEGPNVTTPKKNHPGPAVPLMALIHAVRHPDGANGSRCPMPESDPTTGSLDPIPYHGTDIYIYIYLPTF